MEFYYEDMPVFQDGKWNRPLLRQNRWLYYLCITKNRAANVERVRAVSDITGFETLCYALRTLEILEQDRSLLSDQQYRRLKRVLQWAETAKGGAPGQRRKWLEQGLPLEIHNLASAEIFAKEGAADLPDSEKKIIYILIRTHGIIGQNIRGEVSVSENRALSELAKDGLVSTDELEQMLFVLNHCVIGAVDAALWERVRLKAQLLIRRVAEGNLEEYDTEERIRGLCPSFYEIPPQLTALFAEKIFPNYELWYFESALSEFAPQEVQAVLEQVLKEIGDEPAHQITFKPMADTLYYDYEGKKRINVYKKRIMEKFLRDGATQDAHLEIRVENRTVLVDLAFSAVCEKLTDFCVEAERCGLLTYEKSVLVLFDMFGFRRDEFDRLNNEDKYLRTMNDTEESTKGSIADYVVGKRIVDVGSGGGIMLDLLEEKYPDREVIGTDISANVIAALEKKRQAEHRRWKIVKHNFVDGPLRWKADSIIFSSILHEIFSYTQTKQGKFDIGTVYLALQNAFDSLNAGGRIIIRDGVKTPGPDARLKQAESGRPDSDAGLLQADFRRSDPDAGLLRVNFKTPEGLEFFQNYCRDFKGLPDVKANRPQTVNLQERYAVGDVNFMREFLYTYTWGNESYSHEVQEQFGYLTLEEFLVFFRKVGARVVEAREFLEPGYEEHLSQLVSLYDAEGITEQKFPNSNCILVAEKVL